MASATPFAPRLARWRGLYRFPYTRSRAEKRLLWIGSSLERLRAFPRAARSEAGHQLGRIQHGLQADDWRPMSAVGRGVIEIRIHVGGEHRVVYVASRAEGIYVIHAFEKRTRRTREADLEIARTNLAAITRRNTE